MNKLKKINKQFKMQKTAMTWLIKEISDQKEFKKVSNMFMNLDKDKSGYLTKDEILLGYTEL